MQHVDIPDNKVSWFDFTCSSSVVHTEIKFSGINILHGIGDHSRMKLLRRKYLFVQSIIQISWLFHNTYRLGRMKIYINIHRTVLITNSTIRIWMYHTSLISKWLIFYPTHELTRILLYRRSLIYCSHTHFTLLSSI